MKTSYQDFFHSNNWLFMLLNIDTNLPFSTFLDSNCQVLTCDPIGYAYTYAYDYDYGYVYTSSSMKM